MSDSHGAKGNLLEIVEMHMDDADLFVFLGDGESDIEDVQALYPNLNYEVLSGNCDWYSTKPAAKVIDFGGKRILMSHGHPYNVKFGYENIINESRYCNADICMFGHTHIPYSNYDDGLYIINPGSVRDGKYAMVDIVNGSVMLNLATL